MNAAQVVVPVERLQRWVSNFHERHGGPAAGSSDLLVPGERRVAGDGSWFEFDSLFGGVVLEGRPDPAVPEDWALLIVRKGGFAVARLNGAELVSSKVGRRHVQGRSKAGGQSQQRFARRRDNQARASWQAAAERLVEHCADLRGPVVTAGDQASIREVLADRRLRAPQELRWSGDVAEPRRETLLGLVGEVTGWLVRVENAV